MVTCDDLHRPPSILCRPKEATAQELTPTPSETVDLSMLVQRPANRSGTTRCAVPVRLIERDFPIKPSMMVHIATDVQQGHS